MKVSKKIALTLRRPTQKRWCDIVITDMSLPCSDNFNMDEFIIKDWCLQTFGEPS